MRSIGIAAIVFATSAHLATASAPEGATFRYASSGDVLTLDPHASSESLTGAVLGNVYEGLVARRWDLEIEPSLATEWSRRDATTWRFVLRRGVVFHDGSPFTADDVVFSVRRATHRDSQLVGLLSAVKEARKVDDHTVDILTDGPRPTLLSGLFVLRVMSRRWCEAHGTAVPAPGYDQENYATRHANGTGPFRVAERVVDTRTVLVANPEWWNAARREHNLARAEFRPLASAATRVAALLSGEVDLVYPVPLQDIPRVRATPGFDVLQTPEVRVIFLGFDQWRDELLDLPGTGRNPFKDVRVRRAFYQAIDVDAIHHKIMRGASLPTGVMVAKQIVGWEPELARRYPYDPTAARKLLAEAGYPGGFPVTLDCPNNRYVNDEAICQAVVSMLGRIGVNVTLNAMTKSKYFDKIGRRQGNNTSFFLTGLASATNDAQNLLLTAMAMRGEGAGIFNSGRYTNPRVEEIVSAIPFEPDAQKREHMMREALRIHKEDFGHIPLHQQMVAWGVRNGVSVKLNPADAVLLRYVKVEERGRAAQPTSMGARTDVGRLRPGD